MTRVSISGSAVISAAGIGVEPLLEVMNRGATCVQFHDEEPWPTARVVIPGWPEEPAWLDREKYAARAARLAIAVTDLALANAGWLPANADRCATVVASATDRSDRQALVDVVLPTNDPRPMARRIYDDLNDFHVLRMLPSTVAQLVATRAGFRGGAATVGAPAYDGLAALSVARNMIDSGEADTVLVVGIDVGPSPETVCALHRHESLSRSLGGGPFSPERDGARLGEGAAAVLVENGARAAARGVTPFAELLACETRASTSARAALGALLESCPAGSVVFSGARGSPELDRIEAEALAHLKPAAVTASRGAIGWMPFTSALMDICLSTDCLRCGTVPPVRLTPGDAPPDLPLVVGAPRAVRAEHACVVSTETFVSDGAGVAMLRGVPT